MMSKQRASIPKDVTLPDALNYDILKKKGIESLQQLSKAHWTDYNEHDPGLTILEVLCYALTDLSNRACQSIPDLLAEDPTQSHSVPDSLFPAHQVFSNHPLTLNDYKKIVLDNFCSDLKNVWIKPVILSDQFGITGLYSVEIELAGAQTDLGLKSAQRPTAVEPHELKGNVQKMLNAHRNIGELFTEVTILDHWPLAVGAVIDIEKDYLPEDVVARALWKINAYFDPYLRVHTLQQRLDEGDEIEDIFSGPSLHRGFLHEQHFHSKLSHISTDALIKEVMQVAGVQAVHRLYVLPLTEWGTSSEPSGNLPNFLLIDPSRIPLLNVSTSVSLWTITFKGIALSFDRDRTLLKYLDLRQGDHDNARSELPINVLQLPVEPGSYHQLGLYESIQHLFPAIYSVGEEDLLAESSPIRQAQRLQLKAYLLFFEQVMANFCAQVEHTKHLLSPATQARTYFTQPLYGVPQVAPLLMGSESPLDYWAMEEDWKAFKDNLQNSYVRQLDALVEHRAEFLDRRRTFLSHLLARFGYNIANYNPLLTDPEEMLANDVNIKERFLQRMTMAVYHRGAASIKLFPDASQTITGLELFLYLLTGVDYYPQKIANNEQVARIEEKVLFMNWNQPYSVDAQDSEVTQPELVVRGPIQDVAGLLKLIRRKSLMEPLDSHTVTIEGDQELIEVSLTRFPISNEVSVGQLILDTIDQIDSQLDRFTLIDHLILKPSDEQPVFYRLPTGKTPTEQTCRPDQGQPYSTLLNSKEGSPDDQLWVRLTDGQFVDQAFFNFRISLILPDFTRRFQETNPEAGDLYSFRHYFQYLVSTYAPAHLFVNFIWFDLKALRAWEVIYTDFLLLSEQFASGQAVDAALFDRRREEIIAFLLLYAKPTASLS